MEISKCGSMQKKRKQNQKTKTKKENPTPPPPKKSTDVGKPRDTC